MSRVSSCFTAVVLATGFVIGITGCKGGGESGVGGASGGAPGTGGGSGGVIGSGGASGAIGSGGASGTAGGSGGASGATGGSGGDAGTPTETCDQAPAPRRQSGTIITLPVDTVYDGMPFKLGEPNQVAGGATVTPLNLRFYVSDVELITDGGGTVPVDIVTTTGAPAAYGLFLYNADDPDAQTLRLLAPQGSYVGMKLALGMSAACNGGGAAGRSFPLSADSQMTWEHLMGYLFLRYEGMTAGGAGAGPQVPTLIHMGADLMNLGKTTALTVHVDGAFSVPASAPGTTAPGSSSIERRLRVAMDQVFKGATTDVDLTGVPFATQPDIAAGERLRRSGPDLPLMVLGP